MSTVEFVWFSDGSPSGLPFTMPVQLIRWTPPASQGLYAITVPDISIKPKPFRVIYFGETGDFSERGFPRSHHRFNDWVRHAGHEAQLMVSLHPMSGSTSQQRRDVERRLIETYNPVCNAI
ncbi:MAG TPA: hypothetical protein VFK80_02355 [Limnochordia bacterium]|nr:hypothetical protein [Limnochordia bacterium]